MSYPLGERQGQDFQAGNLKWLAFGVYPHVSLIRELEGIGTATARPQVMTTLIFMPPYLHVNLKQQCE
jgi:hypothetical protein